MEKESTLEFTFEHKKSLGPEEQSSIIKAFRNYDVNKDGRMDQGEFKQIMIDLGYRKITDDKCKQMLDEQDQDHDGFLSWKEFVDMMIKMKGSDDGKFGAIITSADGREIAQVQGDGAHHSYAIEERITFAKMVNNLLEKDEDLADRLPMNVEDESLFHVFDNGVVLCKLLHYLDPDAMDLRALNNSANMNVYQIQENLKMGISGAKALGIKMVGVDANDFIKKVPHLVLGTVW